MTSPSLTDRYVGAVVRSLPHARRDEVATELRSQIASVIGRGVPEADAVRELGDPRLVARRFDARRHHRVGIGAALMPSYVRVLRDTLIVVVPVTAALAGLVEAAAPDSDGGTVATAAALTALAVGGVVAVVVTLAFVLVPRLVRPRAWSLDELPEDPHEHRVAFADVVLTGVAALAALGVLAWQAAASPIRAVDGTEVPILQPELWDLWGWVLVGLLLASVVVLVVVYRRGRWSMPLALANLAIDVGLFVLAVWLAATDRILNPPAQVALAESFDRQVLAAVPTALVALVLGVLLVVDATSALRAARR